jgi:hypothetical protein
MWSSKEVLLISIATGFIFCFATIYAQNSMTKYVNRKIQEKTGANPLIGTGLASVAQHPQQHLQEQADLQYDSAKVHNAPPGSGKRWTPLTT